MKRLVFPKALFVNHPEDNFSDDGNYFRCVYYKDKLPISVLHDSKDQRCYVDIRLDYLGRDYHEYREDYSVLDEFNGVDDEKFSMDKFISNCEFILDKYIENPVHVEPAKPKMTVEDLAIILKPIVESFGFYMRKKDGGIPFEIVDGKGIVKFYISRNQNWDSWKANRIVKCQLTVKVAEVKKAGSFLRASELESYAEAVTQAWMLLKRLEGDDLRYEEVYNG